MSLVAYYSSSGESEDDSAASKKVLSDQATIKTIKSHNNKMKIMAPTKSRKSDDSDDDDQPPMKRSCKPTTKSSLSGLFDKLPAPNGSFGGTKIANMIDNRSMVPYVLTKRPSTAATSHKQSAIKRKALMKKPDSSSDEEEDEVPFFSFVDKEKVESKECLQHSESALVTELNPSSQPSNGKVVTENQTTMAASGTSYQPSTASGTGYQPSTSSGTSYQPSTASGTSYQPSTASGTSYQPAAVSGTSYQLTYQASSYQPGNQQVSAAPQQHYGPMVVPDYQHGYGYQQAEDVIAQKEQEESEMLQKLQGRSRGRKQEKIEFIDVNADDALEGARENLLKSLTKETSMNRQSHSKKGANMPTSRQKSKHQLSYLIHQAKANDIQLQEQWAAGKAKRDAARMRYGF